jgi:hypothetical protein
LVTQDSVQDMPVTLSWLHFQQLVKRRFVAHYTILFTGSDG